LLSQTLKLLTQGGITALLTLISVGCAPTLDLKDFESLPLSQPLHRYTIAHRGSLHQGYPDNSIPALKESVAQGVQFLEVDVRKGGDGTLFIFHDGSLKDTNFASPQELTGKRVQELNPSERESVRLDKGGTVHIPTLKEALDVVSQSKTATLQIDLKGESDELLQAVIDLLKREKKLSRSVIQLKNPERIQRIRAQEPAVRILARCKDTAQLDQAIAARVEFVELERWITAEAVAKCHAANITVVLNVAAPPYDNRETWEFFRARGVDSVMTDHAVLAR
jgi:glycerophosphoryl diester phosphodiesterase